MGQRDHQPTRNSIGGGSDKTSLVCLNSGSMTRFANQEGHSDSAIDLTLVSVTICDDCMLETLECHGSDHVPCLSMVRRKRSRVKKKVKGLSRTPLMKVTLSVS